MRMEMRDEFDQLHDYCKIDGIVCMIRRVEPSPPFIFVYNGPPCFIILLFCPTLINHLINSCHLSFANHFPPRTSIIGHEFGNYRLSWCHRIHHIERAFTEGKPLTAAGTHEFTTCTLWILTWDCCTYEEISSSVLGQHTVIMECNGGSLHGG